MKPKTNQMIKKVKCLPDKQPPALKLWQKIVFIDIAAADMKTNSHCKTVEVILKGSYSVKTLEDLFKYIKPRFRNVKVRWMTQGIYIQTANCSVIINQINPM